MEVEHTIAQAKDVNAQLVHSTMSPSSGALSVVITNTTTSTTRDANTVLLPHQSYTKEFAVSAQLILITTQPSRDVLPVMMDLSIIQPRRFVNAQLISLILKTVNVSHAWHPGIGMESTVFPVQKIRFTVLFQESVNAHHICHICLTAGVYHVEVEASGIAIVKLVTLARKHSTTTLPPKDASALRPLHTS